MGKTCRKLIERTGQHAIEYSVVLILIMAAIIIAGPHVIRSWNANMQGWEDSVIDSFEDPLLTTNAAFGLPTCECDYAPGDVNFDCGLSFCDVTELYEQCVCNPVGCGRSEPTAAACVEGSGRCTCNGSCCGNPVPLGCDFINRCMNTQLTCCGGNIIRCIPDPLCGNICIEPVVEPPNSTRCPGFGVNLGATTNIAIINCVKTNPTDTTCNCTNSPVEGHCNITCDPPYFPDLGNTNCVFCPLGQVLQGDCAAGECETIAPCAAGQCLGG